MGSFNDDDSSNVSLGSKDNRTYSVESSSIHSHVNPNNTFAATGITSDGSPLMRLRSNSPSLGSDASFYDAPYSSVAEIGVDPATVIPAELPPSQPSEESRHQFVNTLYNERRKNDQEDASIDSYTTINPLYETTKIETSQQDDEHNNDVGAEDNKSQQDLLSQEILFLPPPPPEYSDYDDVDILHTYTNEVTDF
ncbi:uncharacterized protein LOC124434423 [Xenia sp. Carnegie-2017]|uniref:uncharacterized protein LOC124434423 n=1 Tax=Xenia sp. Carnegie-2017 TaxID=2897299 RepID=UPI001F04E435|nr:uncharacterized protein LOC124434423 [Xenia sp. Carnegie-2017]